MADQDPPEEELLGEEMDEKAASSFSVLSSNVRAMIRIRQKYYAMKKRRMEMAVVASNSPISRNSTSPKIFTFDALSPHRTMAPRERKKKRKRRVLFPSATRRVVPARERSRAKNCLTLLCVIVFLQVYNAIENLDDHVLKYDLEGLDKTLKREVFGQQEVTEGLLGHFTDYLSTYIHSKPLVLSLHGPSGIGKSHLGRVLAQHFRSVVGVQLVMQYYVLHHCPTEEEIPHCVQMLDQLVSDMVTQAEKEEKIPIFIFDEMEHMPVELLDKLHELILSRHTNEYQNVIYIFISNLGHEEITKFVLHNNSVTATTRAVRLSWELSPLLARNLRKYHPLWEGAEVLPLTLLEKSHVMECFIDEMSREGFYPDHSHVKQLADDLPYYVVGEREFSRTGCKQVVARVNLL